jgi:two-component system LytT family response regulator
MIKAYLVDDERPAIERLSRMLKATGRVEILGGAADPTEALAALSALHPDVLFLDIRMPEISGFQLLAELPDPPLVVFTTAYNEYALDAFQADSIDYLVKPVEPEELDRALAKAERFIRGARSDDPGAARDDDLRALIGRIAASTLPMWERGAKLTHLASRSGQKVSVIDLRDVTHLYAEDKLTFAATRERAYVIDQTIAELEQKLDPAQFIRIHRAVILNLDHLRELHAGFGGRMIARLKGPAQTELTVSRARVRALKDRLGW